MTEYITAILLVLGAFFTLVAAVGIVRLPDLLMRMHASTKAGTLGTGFILAAVAVMTPETGVITRSIATIVFLIITAPVAAHLIGRASYFVGIKLWEGTIVDDFAAQFDRHALEKAEKKERKPAISRKKTGKQ